MKRKLFISLMSIIFIFSSIMFFKDIWQRYQDENRFEILRNKIEKQSSTNKNDFKNIEENTDKELQILPQYKDIIEINDEFVGWIEIENTKINYPVMQTPNNEEYYLHRNFKKEYSVSGTPFLSAKSLIYDSNNQIVIYGHNMKNGTMFSDLLLYKDKEFWKNNSIIFLDTMYNRKKFEVFAAFEIDAEIGNGHFEFYKYSTFRDNDEFKAFLKEIEALSLYNTEIDINFGETILTLVTCDKENSSNRMVVMGVEKN